MFNKSQNNNKKKIINVLCGVMLDLLIVQIAIQKEQTNKIKKICC